MQILEEPRWWWWCRLIHRWRRSRPRRDITDYVSLVWIGLAAGFHLIIKLPRVLAILEGRLDILPLVALAYSRIDSIIRLD